MQGGKRGGVGGHNNTFRRFEAQVGNSGEEDKNVAKGKGGSEPTGNDNSNIVSIGAREGGSVSDCGCGAEGPCASSGGWLWRERQNC